MQKSKLQYLIWGLCLVILFQASWAGFRLSQLRQREIENARAQEQMLQEQEERAKEELKAIAEPEIKEKLASGGRLWLKPREGSFEEEFELEIWAEIDQGKEIKKIDLRLFYPPDLLKLTDEEWLKDEGVIFWSKEREESLGGEFIVKTLSFTPLKSGTAEIEFDFNKESLLDCNLLDLDGNDILERVETGVYQINK